MMRKRNNQQPQTDVKKPKHDRVFAGVSSEEGRKFHTNCEKIKKGKII